MSRHGPASSHQEALTKYLLSKLLGDTDTSPLASSQRRDSDSAAGFKFPLVSVSAACMALLGWPIFGHKGHKHNFSPSMKFWGKA